MKPPKTRVRGVNWFERGRAAYAEGCACEFSDERVRGDRRRDWYAGWQHQAGLNVAAAMPEEERVACLAEIQAIIADLKAM